MHDQSLVSLRAFDAAMTVATSAVSEAHGLHPQIMDAINSQELEELTRLQEARRRLVALIASALEMISAALEVGKAELERARAARLAPA